MNHRLMKLGLTMVVVCAVGLSAQEQGTVGGEWPTYGGNLSNDRYSPLDLITAENFSEMEVAWQFSTDNFGPTPENNLQSTPLMVNGVLYSTAGTRRSVVALDAATGELLWMYRLDEGERAEKSPRQLSGRGLTYRDNGGSGVVFYVTIGYQLVALDAATGEPVPAFGGNGIVDLRLNFDQELDPVEADIGLHSAPIVAGDTIVIGAAHRFGLFPVSRENIKGHIRGYDARTGERKWIFHTIPTADEYGNDSWLNDSWRYTGNAGVWGQMSIDPELNMAYFPVEAPTGDVYGGHRHGDNLFAGSVVAVDLDTGERVWHFQTVHHDIWDADLPAAPVLTDITVGGREIKALVIPTKQALLFVLDRETGEPVWPIEELPVEAGDVPGEWYSPTQPFPTKPPPIDMTDVTVDRLIDFTPELREQAEAIASRYKLGSLYTPPIVGSADGKFGTLRASLTGGVNWPGGSFDPETGMFYAYSKSEVSSFNLISDPERSDMNYIFGPPEGVRRRDAATNIRGLPILKPPWGRITAVDLNRGEIAWQVPHGEAPDSIKNHPLLEGIDIGRTGWPGRIGVLVTKTLVIAGDSAFHTTTTGESGAMLRAYDKGTGDEVGAVYMPAPQTGSPMTYMVDDTQYIVVASSGGGRAGRLVAFRVP